MSNKNRKPRLGTALLIAGLAGLGLYFVAVPLLIHFGISKYLPVGLFITFFNAPLVVLVLAVAQKRIEKGKIKKDNLFRALTPAQIFLIAALFFFSVAFWFTGEIDSSPSTFYVIMFLLGGASLHIAGLLAIFRFARKRIVSETPINNSTQIVVPANPVLPAPTKEKNPEPQSPPTVKPQVHSEPIDRYYFPLSGTKSTKYTVSDYYIEKKNGQYTVYLSLMYHSSEKPGYYEEKKVVQTIQKEWLSNSWDAFLSFYRNKINKEYYDISVVDSDPDLKRFLGFSDVRGYSYINDKSYIRDLRVNPSVTAPLFGWQTYDVVFDTRPYSWEYVVDTADYMATADLTLRELSVNELSGKQDIFRPGDNNDAPRSIKEMEQLQTEHASLAIMGLSKVLGCMIRIVWFNQTNLLRVFAPVNDTSLITCYVETVVRRTFNTEKAMAIAKSI